MCGIAGSTEDPDGRLVRAMCATLRHRGPDDEGVHCDPPAGVSIGARRLSVMDLDGGHQPLCNEDGSIWAAFNGEIYNHRKLREDLRRRGHSFTTAGDTEVLVHLYEEFGEAMVHALEGMFSFAIWDQRERRLLLARDRFGEKPLFVHEHGGELLFASELTSLLEVKPSLRELDPYAIDAFFVFAYVPGPGTIVPGVRQLPPGQLLSWRRQDRRCEQRSWWSPPQRGSRRRESFAAVAAEASELFEQAVATRMVADVPVGVFLSGGVDSTLVASAAARTSSQRLQTFTVGYDVGGVNETERARSVAAKLGSEHHEVTLTQADVAGRVPALLASLDQPLADRATVPLHALSEFARPRVTVALGGEGADELFGGYPRYRRLEQARRVHAALPTVALRPLAGALRASGGLAAASRASRRLAPTPMIERNLDWVTAARRHLRDGLYGPRLAELDRSRVLTDLGLRAGELDGGTAARWLMHLDQVHYLPDDVLVKTDRASMLVSLELRSVFLHAGLAELAGSLDTSMHLSGAGKALVHSMLPAGLISSSRGGRYRKTAFRVPAAEWLRGPLAATLGEQLEQGSIYSEGYFDRGAVAQLAREHASGASDHSDRLWPLLAFGLWADRFHGLERR
ncbi:MAG TPA: asparagine synthase (glutamine-hydrolyzing) [Solirubrobacteraceae bacterium]|jgi:asparagine synthase (glutamine-hydrolysing)|nr:asparagine synthase (glutamine-hydrolyzing) [Solirubrobacteraceae bacterium]